MIELQALREAQPGIAFPPDTDWQREFEAAFPYQETPDQLTTLAEIKARHGTRPADGSPDLRRRRLRQDRAGHPRRLQGDRQRPAGRRAGADHRPGRAALPHLLAAPGRVSVRRRVPSAASAPPANRNASSKRLAEGGIDVIIGTHRLVSADVQFKDLGLVIIDEEQRFGVEHKERLKQLRQTVDVLTLTATPIPRTLHLSLLGIRDISNLETPPPDRLAIETRIVRFDKQLIRHAILRELNREGQVYFVHNRVHNIHDIADKLQQIVPEARIVIGPRPDARATSWKQAMVQLRPPRGRHPGGDDDHRERPGHSQRQHDLHQPGGQLRPGRPAPVARPGGPVQAPGLRLPAAGRRTQAITPHGGAAAQGDRGVHRAGRRLQDRHARPGDSRRRQHPRHAAERPHRRGRLRAVLPAAGKRRAQAEEPAAADAAGGDARPALAGLSAARLRAGPEAAHRGLSPAGAHAHAAIGWRISARSCAIATAPCPSRPSGCCAWRSCACWPGAGRW